MPDRPRIKAPRCTERLELEQEMKTYLLQFREALEFGCFAEKTDDYDHFYENNQKLLWATRKFDELTRNDLGASRVIEGDEDVGLIDYINHSNLMGAMPLSEVISDYYSDLGGGLKDVVKKFQTQGMKYPMDGVLWYNEEAAYDIEMLSRKFTWGTNEGRDQLCIRSPEYLALDKQRGARAKRMAGRLKKLGLGRKGLRTMERHSIMTDLRGVASMLKEGHPPSTTGPKLLLATNDLIHCLSENLGQRGLNEIGTQGNRPLDGLPGGPLEQFKALIELLNDMIRDFEQGITLNRDLIAGLRQVA